MRRFSVKYSAPPHAKAAQTADTMSTIRPPPPTAPHEQDNSSEEDPETNCNKDLGKAAEELERLVLGRQRHTPSGSVMGKGNDGRCLHLGQISGGDAGTQVFGCEGHLFHKNPPNSQSPELPARRA
ncbi:hypothetical protein [Cereibacter johrii]|uniref:hypothetical protein n=1 Tax=Cereibacter johrii TaxID=445629 RepID=UPI001F2D0D43|nr:hypothetical protein [Cereibacter johrii]